MKSPFKFLDSFTLADKHSFFGRDKEIEDLYQMVFKSPLILVYGQSGTGKTSLIQCGLAGKFDGPDWLPIFIRRQGDFRKSIKDEMQAATKGNGGESLVDSVRYLFGFYLRPVYLIFDQFEEMFTVDPSPEEQEMFRNELMALLAAELPCKVILAMREEYIGQLYEMEKYIPTIFDFRLRVEPMNMTKVKEVMKASFKKFNISLEGDEEERLQQMTDNISSGKSGIQLPYLQVYLDMLYREDYERTYKNKPPEEELPPLTFTKSEIYKFGKIEDVLDKFLQEQVSSLQKTLNTNTQFSEVPEDAVQRVLDSFVTEEGTKRPVFYERHEYIILSEPVATFVAGIPENALTWILENLEIRRILRFSKDQIELAHDSLAAKIDEKRTDEQKQLNEVRRRLLNNFEEGEYLTRKQLNNYEDFFHKLKLEEEVELYIQKSRENVEYLENEERRKQEEKLRLVEEKLEAETKAKRKQRMLSRIIGVFAIAALGLGVAAGYQAETIKLNAFNGALTNGHNAIKVGQYDLAYDHLEIAGDLQKNIYFKKAGIKDTVRILEEKWSTLKMLVNEADSLREFENKWSNVLVKYKSAESLADNPMLVSKRRKLEGDILSRFNTYKKSITMILEFADCGPEVCSVYKKAMFLKSDDEELNRKMKECNCSQYD